MKNEKSLRIVDWGRVKCVSAFLITLIIAVMSFGATAQTKSVSGTVTDEAGEPLIGANVAVKGTNTGTVTDFNGEFALTNIETV